VSSRHFQASRFGFFSREVREWSFAVRQKLARTTQQHDHEALELMPRQGIVCARSRFYFFDD
jgi:hypothetical protein